MIYNSIWETNNFLDALWLSLLCILMVFVVLIVITLIMSSLNYIRALDVKESVTMRNGEKLDEDALAAVLVASIDFRKECKEDFKVVSCKVIDEEKKEMRIYKIKVNGKTYEVKILSVTETEPLVVENKKAEAPKEAPIAVATEAPKKEEVTDGIQVNSPMQGTILNINVKVGDNVHSGDNLLILEAMKLENEIKAPQDGKILSIAVNKGAAVNAGDLLIVLG